MRIAEKEMRMIPLEGESAEEIAAHFEKLTNELYSKAEMRFSSYYGEMMPWTLMNTYLREIKGKYFAELEHGFYYNPPEDDEDN